MATYNTQWEQTLFSEMNRVRTQPKVVAAEMESLKASYNGILFKFPNGKSTKTTEGVAALNNCIAYLNQVAPAGAFTKLSDGLSRSALDLVQDNGSKGLVGNVLSNGTQSPQRWVSYGQWKGKIGENIFFSVDDPRQIVYQWIIDDGNSNRPNRMTMMNPAFTVVGVSHGPHSKYANMTVATFALSFVDGGPGVAPSVGQSKDGRHTVQSANRKTTEDIISGTGNNFEISTDDLAATDVSDLKLTAKGKVLTLEKMFKSGGKTKKKNLQWQLPFSFTPSTISAVLKAGEVTITIPKPSPGAGSGTDTVPLGEFTVEAAGNDTLKIEVKKAGGKYVLSVSGSKQTEKVSVSYQNDMFIFSGVPVSNVNAAPTVLPVRLPFTLSADLVELSAESTKIVAKITKGTDGPVTIPIRAE